MQLAPENVNDPIPNNRLDVFLCPDNFIEVESSPVFAVVLLMYVLLLFLLDTDWELTSLAAGLARR